MLITWTKPALLHFNPLCIITTSTFGTSSHMYIITTSTFGTSSHMYIITTSTLSWHFHPHYPHINYTWHFQPHVQYYHISFMTLPSTITLSPHQLLAPPATCTLSPHQLYHDTSIHIIPTSTIHGTSNHMYSITTSALWHFHPQLHYHHINFLPLPSTYTIYIVTTATAWTL